MKRKLRLLLAPLLLSSPFLLGQESVTPRTAYRPQDPEPVWATSFDEAVDRARSMPDGRVFVELSRALPPVRTDGQPRLSLRILSGLHEGQGPREPPSRLARRRPALRALRSPAQPGVARPHARPPPRRQAGGGFEPVDLVRPLRRLRARPGPCFGRSSPRRRRLRATSPRPSPSAKRPFAASATRWPRSASGVSPTTPRPRTTPRKAALLPRLDRPRGSAHRRSREGPEKDPRHDEGPGPEGEGRAPPRGRRPRPRRSREGGGTARGLPRGAPGIPAAASGRGPPESPRRRRSAEGPRNDASHPPAVRRDR